MATFYVGFARAGGAVLDVGGPGLHGTVSMPWAIPVPARVSLAAARYAPYLLTLALDPASLTATVSRVDSATLHYFRLTDATVKPLPPTPPTLAFQRGDAYLAVTPGAAQLAQAQPGGPSAAVARFIHLRDYFNAHKLAAALLAHLLELSPSEDPAGAGVLVVELR